MKKNLIIVLLISLITIGCDNILNTPVDTVQSFLGKYQKLDNNVLLELENIISNNYKVNEEEKKEYKNIFEKQYQNLSYKIVNEESDDKSAIIITEIEVLDYKSTIKKANEYYRKHKNKLKKEYPNSTDYRLSELKKTTNKIKYEIIFTLERKDNKWKIKDLNADEILKIHGLY